MTRSIPDSSQLDKGLRRLKTLLGCSLEEEPEFLCSERKWLLRVTLRIESSSDYVPAQTNWVVLIDETYPFGDLAFYPSQEGGLASTFPHQERNTPNVGKEWREGKLCLASPFQQERHTTDVHDPIGNSENRLLWHVQRALEWLKAAATDRLLVQNDPFELPALLCRPLKEGGYKHLVYDETVDSYAVWKKYSKKNVGWASIGKVPGIDSTACIYQFTTFENEIIMNWTGRVELDEAFFAIWWLWPKPIVIPPWKTPDSWGELRKAGKVTGIKVDAVLKRLVPTIRKCEARVILLLGYPISTYVGLKPCEVHWDAILFPHLEPESGPPLKGFRCNRRGWWMRDKSGPLADKECLEYLCTENWSSERLQARGRLPKKLCDSDIAIIGIGALGAILAEMLVRAGVQRITLIDSDRIGAGNICRHTATLSDIYRTKVSTVAEHLLAISPFVKVQEIKEKVPTDLSKMVRMFEDSDVIVDCTASDEALSLLSRGWWSMPRIFASFSLGFAAKRLFSFGILGNEFPIEQFDSALKPWLDKDVNDWHQHGEVLEGAGCWSPLFPARCDDTILAAAICVKELEFLVSLRPQKPCLRIFEKHESEGEFFGYSLQCENEDKIEDIQV